MNTNMKVQEFVEKYGGKAVWQVEEMIGRLVNEVVKEERGKLRDEFDRIKAISNRLEREIDRIDDICDRNLQ